MKTGIIIYITGNIPDNWNEDPDDIKKCLGSKADRIECVLSKYSSFDIHDAWWALLAKGMQRIICKIAIFDASDRLKCTGKELRLCG